MRSRKELLNEIKVLNEIKRGLELDIGKFETYKANLAGDIKQTIDSINFQINKIKNGTKSIR